MHNLQFRAQTLYQQIEISMYRLQPGTRTKEKSQYIIFHRELF